MTTEIKKEAFHLQGTHWVPVPASGSCPATHPNKLKFPGTDTERCFTDSAAENVKQTMQEQERPPLNTQNYILSKERFKTEAEARKWMKDNDVPTPKIDETENTFRFRQFPDERCEKDSFKAKDITDGVQILGCRLKPEFRKESEHLEKLTNERAQLRTAREDDPSERCGFCQYFVKPNICKIVEGPVTADQVCDWIQSREVEQFPGYNVSDEDWLAFVQGMVERQPYQHMVIDGTLTPEGPVVLIEDTADPKHRFSLTKDFHIDHTNLEHHWTQEEVDKWIAIGKNKVKESGMWSASDRTDILNRINESRNLGADSKYKSLEKLWQDNDMRFLKHSFYSTMRVIRTAEHQKFEELIKESCKKFPGPPTMIRLYNENRIIKCSSSGKSFQFLKSARIEEISKSPPN